jgi:predicted RNase H-like HicB family nuclease
MARPKADKKARVATELHLTGKLLKQKRYGWVVAWCPELDVGSQGDNAEDARRMLAEAVRIFLEECGRMGTLQQVLEESRLPQVALDQPLPVTLRFPDGEKHQLTAAV